jgi:hypothetical protein
MRLDNLRFAVLKQPANIENALNRPRELGPSMQKSVLRAVG